MIAPMPVHALWASTSAVAETTSIDRRGIFGGPDGPSGSALVIYSHSSEVESRPMRYLFSGGNEGFIVAVPQNVFLSPDPVSAAAVGPIKSDSGFFHGPILDWDAHQMAPSSRASGFITVSFEYAGRPAPAPIEDPWA